jgi:hypothetical protein
MIEFHWDQFWLLGSALAITMSFDKNRSIGWAMLHMMAGWLYVIYRSVQRDYESRGRSQ